MILFLLLFLLCLARIVLIVDFPECLLQLYEICVLFFLDLATFGCILFHSLELLLELCDFFLESGLGLLGLFVIEELQLLLLLLPQTSVIFYLFLVILYRGVLCLDPVLQIIHSQ